ncbi:hypothetical protein DL239_21400 [Sedimentitalea sp. CY04]|uniref:Uncharacterized protein n=1 Tax=Parasedimentitalea denitrificans TaxID=2211118 RepID=A0ABX0WDG7_9RHOB|nr:hypothetical protein [Sedimentitalea sp. CY04]NIZ63516.1 hypothetical protein [Sedimentitalea sp. CY04]
MLLTACERPPVFVEPVVSKELTNPCAEPVKGSPSQGAFVEYALGWKATAKCNADKLKSIGKLIGPQ